MVLSYWSRVCGRADLDRDVPEVVQGVYDRDNEFYVKWDAVSRDETTFRKYLDDWVYGLPDRAAYTAKMADRRRELEADRQMCAPVNYGF